MKTFSIGIIGAGAIAQQVHLPVLASMPQVRLAWLTDADAARGSGLAEAYGVPFAALPKEPRELPPCDAALLAIPNKPRNAYYEQFAARGTAVFAEKPLAINALEHARYVSLFEPHKLGCGYMRRMYASNGLLRRAVHEQWFGRLRRARIAEGGRTTRTGVDASYQDLSVAAGGGILINLGCHALDLIFFITGASEYAIRSAQVMFDGDTDRKAETTINLRGVGGRSENSVEFDYVVSWLDYQENTILLEFEHARLSASLGAGGSVTVLAPDSRAPAATLQATHRGAMTTNQAFYLEWEAFLAGLESGRPSLMAASSSILAARLIDDLLRAGR